MRIIHLSDIHFSKNKLSEFRQFYFKALKNDLINNNSKKKIDIVTITGDIIDKGGTSFDKNEKYYKIFEEQFIDPLCRELEITKDNILLVPGNHDINEEEIDEVYENGILSTLKSIEKINDFQNENKDTVHQSIKRIYKYKLFEKEFYKDVKDSYITNFESCFVKIVDGVKVGFACFNSAWRCSKTLPKENLLMGTKQILNANEFFEKNDCQFVIGLIHHPVELFSEIEKQEISNLLQTLNFDIVLAGHTHSTATYHHIGNNGNIFFDVAKSAFNNPREKADKFKSGYSILDIDFEKLEVLCTFRRYVHNRIEFDKDIDVAPDGIYKEQLKPRKDKVEFHKLLQLTNQTCSAKIDNINTSLVIHGTDSVAPRNLNNIFVLPKLTDKPIVFGNMDENSKNYSISNLLSIQSNVLLIGNKETGKTTLLHKIFIEASNNFSKYQLIPIEIDFKSLNRKDLKPLIKDFINEPSSAEIDKLSNDGNFLLLIDNLDENGNLLHAKSKLKKFIELYPKNKIIATTSTSLDLLLTSENTIFSKQDDKISAFKPIFIGSVGVKEFKELAIKWFKNKDSEWLQNNIAKLIKVFEILRIPRTFFAVSLFLWIIEKQENYKPINKATLVSQFLQYILEGLKIENAIAGAYGYDKKIELLSEISYKMYKDGDKLNNYSLTEDQLISCIQKNFELNQLKFSASDKLNEFIDKGILKIDENNYDQIRIRFRYESFFQYFLSLNIDKNLKFKRKVFSEEHFLGFIDELDFYTGRKRDDIDTLKISVERLKLAFKEIDEIISDNVDRYYPDESFFLQNVKPKSFISETRENKLSNNEIEEALGDQMELLPVDDSIRVKKTLAYKVYFNKILELSARVLKNSENIQNPDFLNEALELIINKSAKYGIFLQALVIESYKKGEFKNLPIPPEMIIALSPLINQLMLLTWLGTDFLEIPLSKQIKKYLSKPREELSEYELYLTTFLYADMKLPGYVSFLDKLISKIHNRFIAELSFMKILLYYMFRPEGSHLLPVFEKHMERLLMKSRNMSKAKAKNVVEKNIRVRKKEIQEQLLIDFGDEK